MARKESKGKMSEAQKRKIAEAVRSRAAEKRREQGLPDLDENGINVRTKEIELIKMRDQTFDPHLFIPMKTKKPIDNLFSNLGGVPKACNFIVIGDPGVGKTTVTMDIVADLVEEGYSCLFISAEMTKIDLYEYCKRYPKFGDLDILFLGEYLDDNPKDVVEEVLQTGYDVVLIDSFAEVQEAVKEVNKMSTSGSEKWLIDTMIKQNLGNNEKAKHTTFLCIQQVTKGGEFVGSNKLKHNTTGMMEIRFDDESGISSHISFSKNRRGPVNRKMYFNLQSKENVEYDGQRFDLDETTRDTMNEELEKIKHDADAFDALFKAGDLAFSEAQQKEQEEKLARGEAA